MPKPGTNSLPFGVSGAFTVPDVVVVLGVTEFPVELVVVVDAVPDVLSDFCVFPLGVTAKVVSRFPVGSALRSCTVTGSVWGTGAVVTC